jgi:hypothetical protein
MQNPTNAAHRISAGAKRTRSHFETEADMERFKSSQLEFALVSAVAVMQEFQRKWCR